MSHPSMPSRSGSIPGLLIFGVPIGLAALLVPALFILVPSRGAEPAVTAPTTLRYSRPKLIIPGGSGHLGTLLARELGTSTRNEHPPRTL